MTEKMHELAPHHLPFFIPKADGSDQMMLTVLIALIVIILLLGTFYLYLHSLPERLAHKHGRIQFELVAVLGLLALFTHNQIFWVAALVLAFVQLPDFTTPLDTIASSASRIAKKFDGKGDVAADAYLEDQEAIGSEAVSGQPPAEAAPAKTSESASESPASEAQSEVKA
ncbi:hypothetical protein [Roseibium sp. MMSF_3412]|uniref:hypothetical protein n=1 Tax=Roseibium sp. MMSF_3412 TaxID=3046712 RepID=UPI00273EF54A|nr:hypothetical protein [Roseibium sp. MMSF_3412]